MSESPLILRRNKKITEGRKAGRVSKKPPSPPPPSPPLPFAHGLDLPLNRVVNGNFTSVDY